MTDRELLEKAAKAAGVDIYFDDDGDCYRVKASGNRNYWNPLLFDGDALRLAVRLGITVDMYLERVRAYADELPKTAEESFGADRYAATRCAIVRAAASMVTE